MLDGYGTTSKAWRKEGASPLRAGTLSVDREGEWRENLTIHHPESPGSEWYVGEGAMELKP